MEWTRELLESIINERSDVASQIRTIENRLYLSLYMSYGSRVARGMEMELEDKKLYLQYKLNILKNNQIVVLNNYVVPFIKKIADEYKDKRIGKKTEEKITAKAMDEISCHIWFQRGYGNSLNYYYKNNKLISEGSAVTGILTKENQFDIDRIKKLQLSEGYIENIDERINELLTLRKEIKEDYKRLDIKVDKFNNLMPGCSNQIRVRLNEDY